MTSAPSKPRLTESPWFWVYLFGTAALIGMFLIGPKADQVQAQRDGNFTRRQASLERQASLQRNAETQLAAASVEEAPLPDLELPEEEADRYVDFTPFYLVFGVVTVVAWVMLWREYFRGRKSQ
jgi:hypothetical protein